MKRLFIGMVWVLVSFASDSGLSNQRVLDASNRIQRSYSVSRLNVRPGTKNTCKSRENSERHRSVRFPFARKRVVFESYLFTASDRPRGESDQLISSDRPTSNKLVCASKEGKSDFRKQTSVLLTKKVAKALLRAVLSSCGGSKLGALESESSVSNQIKTTWKSLFTSKVI